MASLSAYIGDKAAEAAKFVKQGVDVDKPLQAEERKIIETVLARAFSTHVDIIRQYAANLEMIRLEDSRKVVDGFHKIIRITSRAMEGPILSLLKAQPAIDTCDFVECNVEKGALVPLLKYRRISHIFISRTLTDNEAESANDLLIHGPSRKAINPYYNGIALASFHRHEGPVQMIVNPYYPPEDADFAKETRSICLTFSSPPTSLTVVGYQRVTHSDLHNSCWATYNRTDLRLIPGLSLPMKCYEDIGFGPVDLTEEGLRPRDPSKSPEDIEVFIYEKMQSIEPELTVTRVVDKTAQPVSPQLPVEPAFLDAALEAVKSRKEYRKAEAGDLDAQFALGVWFWNGQEGFPKSEKEAVRWYIRAAEKGHAGAQVNLGVLYRTGQGVPQSNVEAAKWYRKAADQGDTDAQNNMGTLYLNGRGVPQSCAEAAKWFRKAAEKGHAVAQENLKKLAGFERVPEVKSNAEEGNPQAQYELALWQITGKYGFPISVPEAIVLLKKASAQGYGLADNQMGFLYETGAEGVPKSIEEAFKCYMRGANVGEKTAQFNLGLCFEEGIGTKPSITEALKWFSKSATQGFREAQNKMGELCMLGQGTPPSDQEAAKWFKLAAEQGHPNAQFNLAVFFHKGQGVPQSYSEAAKWYRSAAEQGHPTAQNNLGDFLLKGQGVKQSKKEAFQWFLKAADQGYAFAEFNVGVMHEHGEGGAKKSLDEAKNWYRKAAEKGNVAAQNKMKKYGVIYQ